jgi:hypothetical protein
MWLRPGPEVELRLSGKFGAVRPDESSSGWLEYKGRLEWNPLFPEELRERGISEGEGSVGNREEFKYSFPIGFSRT